MLQDVAEPRELTPGSATTGVFAPPTLLRSGPIARASQTKASFDTDYTAPSVDELIGLGAVVRQHREVVRLTQADLAIRAGISPATLSKIERGYRRPSKSTFQRIASAMRLTTSELQANLADLTTGGEHQVEPLSVAKKASPENVVIRSRVQVIFYSKLIIAALEDALQGTKRRHHNQPPSELLIDDAEYLQEIRHLIKELRRLNSLLQTMRGLKSVPRKPVVEVKKALNTFIQKWAGTVGVGTGVLTLGAMAALLSQLGVGDAIFEQIQRRLPGR